MSKVKDSSSHHKSKYIVFDEKTQQKIFKYYFVPSDESGEDIPLLLLNASDGSGRKGDYSKVDLFIFLQYAEEKNIPLSSLIRTLLFVALENLSPDKLIDRIEADSIPFNEKEASIERSSPLGGLGFVKSVGKLNSDAYFSFLGKAFREISSKQINRDAHNEILSFLGKEEVFLSERLDAEALAKEEKKEGRTPEKEIAKTVADFSAIMDILGKIDSDEGASVQIQELLDIGVFRYYNALRPSENFNHKGIDKEKRASISLEINNNAISSKMIISYERVT